MNQQSAIPPTLLRVAWDALRWFVHLPCRLIRFVGRNRDFTTRTIVLIGILTTGLAILAFANSVHVVGFVANRIFKNSPAPLSREMPITAQPAAYMAGDVQVLGGRGEGLNCSIIKPVERLAFRRNTQTGNGFRPAEATISHQMRQACVFHDYCYRHGAATYGYTQQDCDYLLLEHAYRLCLFINKADKHSKCLTRARKVVLGVRIGGNASFRSATPEMDRLNEAGLLKPAPTYRLLSKFELPPYRLGEVNAAILTRARNKDNLKFNPRLPELLTDCPGAEMQLFDHHCASTYFEFDPNPMHAGAYTVYRIANAPADWVARGALPKALYTFNIRPGGTIVSVSGWLKPFEQAERPPDFCGGVHLPATHGLMQSPPMVVATKRSDLTPDEEAEDWLVWWRWARPDNTAGRLAVIRPAVASLADWQKVFPGATAASGHHLTTCGSDDASWPAQSALARHDFAKDILVGTRKEVSDNNFMQLTPFPGIRADGKLSFVALRSHSCRSNGTTICYLHVVVDPYLNKKEQLQEPLILRDRFNSFGNDNDPDRYRSYATPPLVFGPPSDPVTGIIRRGDPIGRSFNEYAHLRRQQTYRYVDRNKGKDEMQSRDGGTVKLSGLDETREPLLVSARQSARPILFSIAQNGEADVSIKAWTLPQALPPEHEVSKKIFEPDYSAIGNPAAPSSTVECPATVARKLAGWLARPPVAFGNEDGSLRILMQRIELKSDHSLKLQVATLFLKPGSKPGKTCSMVEHAAAIPIPVSPLAAQSADCGFHIPTLTGQRICKMRAYLRLRARPLLFADMDGDGELDYVLPHPASIRQVRMGSLPAN